MNQSPIPAAVGGLDLVVVVVGVVVIVPLLCLGVLLLSRQIAARREADKIVADGIATREDIDKAMMTGRNWPVGFYNSRGTRTGWL